MYVGFGQGYLGDRGDIVALDVETGEVVWHVRLNASVLGLTVVDGMVYAAPSAGTRGEVAMPVVTDTYEPAGSYAVAFDAKTGALRWKSARLDDGNPANGTFVNATPVVYTARGRDLVFVPLSGGSGDGARVPMYFLDARSGKTVRKAFSLTDAEYQQGFGGTGIWSTAAYDPVERHLYAGTADSDGRTRQHRYNNAILKIDADPKRPTFATVVQSYKGISEHADLDAVIGYPNNPLCRQAVAGAPDIDFPTFFDTSASVECVELDFDFGASPMLHEVGGKLRVGELQKAGVFHDVDAGTMTPAWRFFVGPGGPFQDSGSATLTGGRIVTGATPNLLFGLDASGGSLDWVCGEPAWTPSPTSRSARPTASCMRSTTSARCWPTTPPPARPLVDRSIAEDGGFPQCLGAGAGVAVARGTVFAPCDAGGLTDLAGLPDSPGGLVAYRLP